jgi:hypothetical protein
VGGGERVVGGGGEGAAVSCKRFERSSSFIYSCVTTNSYGSEVNVGHMPSKLIYSIGNFWLSMGGLWVIIYIILFLLEVANTLLTIAVKC